MAISRHDPEWLKTIFVAKCLGIELLNMGRRTTVHARHPMHSWAAKCPDGSVCWAGSKYEAALRALAYLTEDTTTRGRDGHPAREPMPDAAVPRPTPPGSGAKRTEEFRE